MFFFSRWEKAALALLAVVILGGLLFWSYQAGRNAAARQLPVLMQGQASPNGPLVVHVSGEVKHPGVVKLAPGERLYQAIAKAGGATPQADIEALNLAEQPLDGDKIVVPAKGQALEAPPGTGGAIVPAKPTSGGHAPSASSPAPRTGPVSLNRATADDLDSLPGIGPTLAARILAYRKGLGARGFTSKEQLLDVPGIGPKRYADIAPLVTL